tara:strand:+ start:3344 stop:3685 length:342 start_codon:yes stop_codon:yes gene_type:complete
MITVGAVHELEFISRFFKEELSFSIEVKGQTLSGIIKDNKIRLIYRDQEIWEEDVYGDANWFGIESCDRIHKIIECIDNDDKSWLSKYSWKQSNSVVTSTSIEEAVKNVGGEW